MSESLINLLQWFASAFTHYKILFERSLSFSDDVVHVLAGLSIQIAAAAVLRTTLKDWRPLAIVFVAELANEVLDITHEVWPIPAMQLGESFKDIILTLAMPIVLMVLTRVCPALFVEQVCDTVNKAPEDSADNER